MNHQKNFSDFIVTFLIKYNNKKRSYSGFTLIELLVVIIIIGVLSAIALPSFLSQGNKAKQTEAKQNLGSYNRAQQTYFLENQTFITTTEDAGKLGLGIPLETQNYSYRFEPIGSVSGEGGGAITIAIPKGAYKGYAGATALVYLTGSSDAVSLTALCESLNFGKEGAPKLADISVVRGDPSTGGGSIQCAGNTVAVR